MAKVCEILKIKPQTGNRVSHANNKNKHRFMPNLQKKRIWHPEQNRFITLKISTKAIRLINKIGIVAALALNTKDKARNT